MDLVYIVRELSYKWRWVAAGAVVAIFIGCLTGYTPQLMPPELKQRSLEISAAHTEVLVDESRPILGDVSRPVEPLTQRAAALSRFVASESVAQEISDITGLSEREISATGPVLEASEAAAAAPSEQRANELLRDSRRYRVQVQQRGELPVLSVYAQAPSPREAELMANATVRALQNVIAQVQRDDSTPVSRQVKLRQLGKARGGVVVEQGANTLVAIVVTVLAFVAICILILVAGSLGRAWKQASEEDAGSVSTDLRFGEDVETTMGLSPMPSWELGEDFLRPGDRTFDPGQTEQHGRSSAGADGNGSRKIGSEVAEPAQDPDGEQLPRNR